MACFDWLNPIANESITTNVPNEDLEKKLFNIEASIQESSFALITNKLYVLEVSCFPICMCKSPCLLVYKC
jgi:hypothetical protein